MKIPQLLLVAIAVVTLPACASRATLPSLDGPEALNAAAIDDSAALGAAQARCGDPLPLVDGAAAWTVEGFGGPDAQMFVTRRVPRDACPASGVTQGGRLDALR